MAQHIKKLNIESLRGISNLSLEGLGDINVLVGDNNSGKTSVLEAILLLTDPSDFSNVITVSRMRDGFKKRIGLQNYGPAFYDSFLYLFNHGKEVPKSSKMKIAVSGEIGNEIAGFKIQGNIVKVLMDIDELDSIAKDYLIREDLLIQGEALEKFEGELIFSFRSNGKLEEMTKPISYHGFVNRVNLEDTIPIIETKFISTIDHIMDNTFHNIIKNHEITQEVVALLKIFDEDILNLKIIQDGHRIIQTIDHAYLGSMPLSTYGDGIKKVIALANGIIGAKNGILLIDEIETSIHEGVMKKVFSWLVEACRKFNVQLFLTTHSIEAVDKFLYSNPRIIEEDMLRAITLVKKENQTVARILTGEKAMQVREDYDLELRK